MLQTLSLCMCCSHMTHTIRNCMISQTTWLKVTPHCNQCNHCMYDDICLPHSWYSLILCILRDRCFNVPKTYRQRFPLAYALWFYSVLQCTALCLFSLSKDFFVDATKIDASTTITTICFTYAAWQSHFLTDDFIRKLCILQPLQQRRMSLYT